MLPLVKVFVGESMRNPLLNKEGVDVYSEFFFIDSNSARIFYF